MPNHPSFMIFASASQFPVYLPLWNLGKPMFAALLRSVQRRVYIRSTGTRSVTCQKWSTDTGAPTSTWAELCAVWQNLNENRTIYNIKMFIPSSQREGILANKVVVPTKVQINCCRCKPEHQLLSIRIHLSLRLLMTSTSRYNMCNIHLVLVRKLGNLLTKYSKS